MLTSINVLPDDVNEGVSVPSLMFMIESDHMHHLVYNGRVLHASIVQRQNLNSTSSTNFRETSEMGSDGCR